MHSDDRQQSAAAPVIRLITGQQKVSWQRLVDKFSHPSGRCPDSYSLRLLRVLYRDLPERRQGVNWCQFSGGLLRESL